jgi:hypothetical protein
MAKISFQIGSKYKHLIGNEKDALTDCEKIWGEFETNVHLKALLNGYAKVKKYIKDSDIDDEAFAVSDKVYNALSRSWDDILCYYALMDNPKSPFQVFKADYAEKSACVLDCIGANKSMIELLGFSPTLINFTQREIDFINNCLLSVRFAYAAVVAPVEWQNVLDSMKFIYDSRRILAEANNSTDIKEKVKIQVDKFALSKEIQNAVVLVQDLISRFYGENARVAHDIETFIAVKTAFREFAVVETPFVDIGQGNSW